MGVRVFLVDGCRAKWVSAVFVVDVGAKWVSAVFVVDVGESGFSAVFWWM